MVGHRYLVEVGPVAHGGHCVARTETGRVVFVRHALPGEQVEIEITEGTDGDRFWRADAVAVLRRSPDRVDPPCPVAGPGGCGGCDFQHVSLPAQRALKAAVIGELLTRIARLDPADPLIAGLQVQAVPGDRAGLRWRTRTRFEPLPDGGRGMRVHRSHRLVRVEDCLLEASSAAGVPGEETVSTRFGELHFTRSRAGFWQVHPGAPRVLVEAVLELLGPEPGERVLDLYAGVGLFARFLADAVAPGGRVVVVEGDRDAVRHARANLIDVPGARFGIGDVAGVLSVDFDEPFDLVVLDPPRRGAGRKVVAQVVDRAPRAVAYVACDPAALARDIDFFGAAGYRLTALRAFDLFPITHHVECVALLTKGGSDLR